MQTLMLDDGIQLAYRADGDSTLPTLVLINSLGTDISMWQPQVARFSRYFYLVRYDSRGHGQSDVPQTQYDLARLGHDLLALLDHLGIARAHLCGISLGGLTAQWLAVHHPERINRVIFANTAARIGSIESWNARINAVQAGGMAGIRAMVIERFLSATFRASDPEATQALGDVLEATSPLGYLAACTVLRDSDLRPLVDTIGVPSLIVGGALDQATPPEQARELHMAIPGSQLVVFPEAAHLSNLDHADAFNDRVMKFLRGME